MTSLRAPGGFCLDSAEGNSTNAHERLLLPSRWDVSSTCNEEQRTHVPCKRPAAFLSSSTHVVDTPTHIKTRH